MEELPRIWVDWNDFCDKDTVWLGLDFIRQHFEKQGISIREGLKIRLFGDDVEADAVVVPHQRLDVGCQDRGKHSNQY